MGHMRYMGEIYNMSEICAWCPPADLACAPHHQICRTMVSYEEYMITRYMQFQCIVEWCHIYGLVLYDMMRYGLVSN